MPATFSITEKPAPQKKKRDQSRSKNQPKFSANGRPGKRTPQLEKALLAAIETGAPYRIACAACSISEDSFTEWRRKDPVFAAQVEKAAGKTALRLLKKIEKCADENFSAAAWILERRFPSDFSRPEVQLNLIQQNNVTENHLSITITESEVREIEAVADPIREKVRAMMESYRPEAIGNGNGEPQKPVVPIEAEIVQEPIERKAGDEKSAAFWNLFVSGSLDRLVEKETAVFVTRTIVGEVLGAHRVGRIEFSGEITIEDILATIERQVGTGSAAGWQRLQQKAGITV
jgi:hypothetical protein